jgi:hypothetical protein
MEATALDATVFINGYFVQTLTRGASGANLTLGAPSDGAIMKTLHIPPGDSAGGSLLRAIRDDGRDEEVLRFRDDLSCGPIDPYEPEVRAAWWGAYHDALEVEAAHRTFWDRVATTDDRLVVWFSQHSARELAFFLAWADQLGERTYDIIDVTGRRLPFRERDGTVALSRPVGSVSMVSSYSLKSLLGKEQPVTAQDRDKSRGRWRQLQIENAPFRIVEETGLVSASIDHFDPWLLAEATLEWQSVRRVVAAAMILNSEPFLQVYDVMLHTRVVALVDEGRLLADGDPWDASSRIRLPG